MLGPISWRTPPRAYGPWELVTSLLTEALVARGVDVTLFATLDSQTAGTLAGVFPRLFGRSVDRCEGVGLLHIAHFFERAGEFDLIHNQADFMPLAFSRLVDTPIVTTIHGFSPRILPVYERYNDRVPTSRSATPTAIHLTYAATIHHGIPVEEFPFDPDGGEICCSSAASIPTRARRGDRRGAPAAEGWSWRASCRTRTIPTGGSRPASMARVAYRGPVGDRATALGQARALLHLIDFDEPFGLSVVEAMACGTPVIAYNRGSMPELIEDGVSGFLVDSFDEAVDAIERLDKIDRSSCRQAVEDRFSVGRMADRYVSLYRSLLEKG